LCSIYLWLAYRDSLDPIWKYWFSVILSSKVYLKQSSY